MRLNEIAYTNALPVDGYGPGFFRIGGEVREGPLLTSGAGPQIWLGLDDAKPLLALAGQVDVLFLGMGADIAHPPEALRQTLEAKGIGIDVMSSPTACRSYNVLLSEGRRIALAALPV